jgi:NAD(P)-dependent dehydrogenase (short-subunit alcohol dehydrogenase family)
MAVLIGKAVAIIAAGSKTDREVAMALAEAGADIAIATLQRDQAQEFATASIANEVWAIGREQISHVLDATNRAAVLAFLDRAALALGGFDAVVVAAEGEPGEATLAAVAGAYDGRRIAVGFDAEGFDHGDAATVVELVAGG